jgi:hypothetical protein
MAPTGYAPRVSTGDRLWDIGLLVLGVVIVALGLINPATAPLWVVLLIVVVVIALVRHQRGRVGSGLVNLGVRVGGQEAIAPHIPPPPAPAPEPAPVAPDPAVAQARDEQRATLRAVSEAIVSAMTLAEDDREHGRDGSRSAAIAAANRAAAQVQEVDDADSRMEVKAWKQAFDAIPKGWKEPSRYEERSPGYPKAAWTELREDADSAIARLGLALRQLADAPAPTRSRWS